MLDFGGSKSISIFKTNDSGASRFCAFLLKLGPQRLDGANTAPGRLLKHYLKCGTRNSAVRCGLENDLDKLYVYVYYIVVICLGGRFVALISPQYISSLHKNIFSPK